MSSLPTNSQPCAALQTLDLGSLAQYFHLRINDVARRLGVCATVLKKVCRKHGIPRWPQRKLASIDRRISLLKKPRRRLGTKEAKRIQLEIDFLLGQRQLLMKDPAAVMGSSAHEDSKCPFEQELVFSDDNDNDNENDSDDSDDRLDEMRDSPNKNAALREATHIDVVFPVAKNENTHPSRMLDEPAPPSVSVSSSSPATPFYRFKAAHPATHGPSQSGNGSLLRRTNGLGGGAMMMKNLSSDSLASLHSNVSGRSSFSSLQYTSDSPSAPIPRASSSSALDALVTVASMAPAPALAPPQPLPLVHPSDVRLPVLMLDSSRPLSSVQSGDSEDEDEDEGKDESDLRFASILRRCGAHVSNNDADAN